MTTVFGFVTDVHKVYGHGDTGTEQCICRTGSYGTGEFPPLFTTRQAAEDYVKTHSNVAGLTIVPLNLYDTIKI